VDMLVGFFVLQRPLTPPSIIYWCSTFLPGQYPWAKKFIVFVYCIPSTTLVGLVDVHRNLITSSGHTCSHDVDGNHSLGRCCRDVGMVVVEEQHL